MRALDPLPAPARLRTVLAYPGAPPAGSLTVAAVVAAAVLFGALSGLVAGLVTGVVTLIALRLRRSRPLVALGAPALLGLCGLYVVAHQLRYRSPPGFEWPTELERIHVVGWLAVAFLVVDVVATRLWTRSDE